MIVVDCSAIKTFCSRSEQRLWRYFRGAKGDNDKAKAENSAFKLEIS